MGMSERTQARLCAYGTLSSPPPPACFVRQNLYVAEVSSSGSMTKGWHFKGSAIQEGEIGHGAQVPAASPPPPPLTPAPPPPRSVHSPSPFNAPLPRRLTPSTPRVASRSCFPHP